MRCLLIACLVAVAGCRSISKVEREAFGRRVAQLQDSVAAARKAAEREPVPAILAERRRKLDDMERDLEEARRVGEAALEFKDRRGLEYARGLLDGVERRLSVLPR